MSAEYVDDKTGTSSRTWRFFRSAIGRPVAGDKRRPIWQPFVMLVIVVYAFYFIYGVFMVNTIESPKKAEGVLRIESCTPNWTLLGVRSSCSGTIEPFDNHFQYGEVVEYDAWFSYFTEEDVGKKIRVYDEFAGVRGRVWKNVNAGHPPVLGELLLGPLFMAAVGFAWVFVADTVLRFLSLLVRVMRRLRGDKAPRPAWQRALGAWAVAFLLGYSAYLTWAMYHVGDLVESEMPDGQLRVESCEANFVMLGLRSVCSGTITPSELGADPIEYHDEHSRLSPSDTGKKVPMLELNGQWVPPGKDNLPDWGGVVMFPLGFATFVITMRAVATTFAAVRSGRGGSGGQARSDAPSDEDGHLADRADSSGNS